MALHQPGPASHPNPVLCSATVPQIRAAISRPPANHHFAGHALQNDEDSAARLFSHTTRNQTSHALSLGISTGETARHASFLHTNPVKQSTSHKMNKVAAEAFLQW